ncbi:hypothetical protein FBZ92_11613 [Nitrospirillum viridazoti]|uniref:Uncharacterized protein n=1 Tax=Nitrospirillum amazonense TaxID=28077 RepID=A0A560I6V4_9PROT|nr:hypothetical protein FBZ92_11613 [Nitrospirillum amazonense]
MFPQTAGAGSRRLALSSLRPAVLAPADAVAFCGGMSLGLYRRYQNFSTHGRSSTSQVQALRC